MKKIGPVISIIFHPLLMPTLGLFLLLNSGTYLSLLDPAAKRALLFVMALGTLLFPLMMIPILYYRKLLNSFQQSSREERLIPHLIILILYIITYIYFARLPLSRVIHGYVLATVLTLSAVLILSIWFKLCLHSAAMGGMAGLIIALIFLYETPLQGVLIIALLAGGLMGSSRLAMGVQRPVEVYGAYLLGFSVLLLTLLAY
ncbi:MAG: hypothetical protein ABFS28_01610 [Bacteroidota bacterium]